MSRIVTIQPKTLPDLTRPYPWHIGDGGRVGRQDFWRGEYSTLVGFQQDIDTMHVDLLTTDFLNDPERAVGMFPVFVNKDGNMFVSEHVIDSVTEWDNGA